MENEAPFRNVSKLVCQASLHRVAAFFVFCFAATVSWADTYRVMPGDVLRMRIMGVPELLSEAPVLSDGSIAFPLIGTIPVSGLTTEEITSEVGLRLLSVSYTARGNDDTSRQIDLAGFETFVEVASYRPIYLDGYVGEPGQAEFRPGLTIRAAIVRAGGVTGAGHLETSDTVALQSFVESQTRAVDVAVLQAKRWRLDALSARDADTTFPDLAQAPVSRDVFESLLTAEQNRVRAELDAYELLRLAILESIDEKDAVLALYDDLIEAGNKLEEADAESVARLQELEDRGLTRGREVDSARRILALSRADNLTGKIGQLNVQQRLDDLRQQLLKAEQDFVRDIAMDYAEVVADLAAAQSRLRSSQMLAGAAQPIETEFGLTNVSVSVYRDGEKLVVGDGLTFDSFVAPGDIVTVTAN